MCFMVLPTSLFNCFNAADTSGISASAIVGIVVGSIAAIAACFIVVLLTVIFVVKRKKGEH